MKSKEVSQHVDVLRSIFLKCRCYNLGKNPLKCAFGVSCGKFLGFIIYYKSKDLDPTKAKAI